ncbi:MAG: hypothetical protein U1G05_17685 [Kiritimatiellia bacterium]
MKTSAACLAALLFSALPGRSADPVAAASYLKSGTTRGGALELRIACRKFESTNHTGTVVWLTGVSHIGTSNYYAKLQTHLDAMEVVLYEGVGDPQSSKDDGELADSLQGGMARALGLKFQLEAIDYSRASFTNSDLTVDQLMRVISESEDPAKTTRDLRELMASMQAGSILSRVMSGLGKWLETSPRAQGLVLAVMIEAMGSLEGDIAEMRGLPPGMQKLMRVLVDERNKAVLADLKGLLARPKPPASVSVFYGAAHMNDFETRMVAELGYRPVETVWLTAMRLNPAEHGLDPSDLRLIRNLVRAEMRAALPPKRAATASPPGPAR